MNKKFKAGAAVLMLLTLVALTSCSMVFYGGLSGKVMDEDNNGIADVRVFLYLDREQWEADRALYEEGKSYDPVNFHKDTYTLENGSYAFDKVMWKTGSSDFGTVADISEAYLIFYAEDWGMESQTVKILSESKNTASPQIMKNRTETFTYRIHMRSSEDSSVPANSRYTMTYSYMGKPGEDGAEYSDDIIVEGSEIVIPVKYYKNAEVPELTLSDIECTVTEKKGGEDVPVWKLRDGESTVYQGSKKTEESFTLHMDELKRETFTYKINFRNAGDMDKDAPSRYTFKYSYTGRPDTEGAWTSETQTLNGSYVEIPVTYYEGEAVPELKLTEVKSGETRTKEQTEIARWRMVDKVSNAAVAEITFLPGTEKTESTVYAPMQEMWWRLPGFSGEVMDNTGAAFPKNAKVSVKLGDAVVDSANVRRQHSNDGTLIRTYFEGLAADEVIWRTAENEVKPLEAEYRIACEATGATFTEMTLSVKSTDPGALDHIVIEAD